MWEFRAGFGRWEWQLRVTCGDLTVTLVCCACFRNYEQIVKAHQDNPNEGKNQISDEVKFNVFQGIMDSLFQSFNASVSVTSFQELSACVFSWIEEHCKPQVNAGLQRGWCHSQGGRDSGTGVAVPPSLHRPTDCVLSLPQTLQDIVIRVLHKVKSQLY